MTTTELLNAIRQGQYTGTGFQPNGWKFTLTDAEAITLLDALEAQELRSCTLCGMTVDVSKGHVAPDPEFTTRGRSKPTARRADGLYTCCANEDRNMNGGCNSCGDPCL